MFEGSKAVIARIRVNTQAASVAAALAFMVLGGASMGGAALAGENCKPVFGPFQSAFADPATCQAGAVFCTEGKVIGGLVGDFNLNVFEQIPTGTDPGVMFFVGESVITMLPERLALVGADTGAIDVDPTRDGHFGTLLRFTGGDGSYQGATGHIVINGNVDFMTGAIMGDYKGELCLT